MLAAPRGHVRQRSIGRSDVDEAEVQVVERLLEEKYDHDDGKEWKESSINTRAKHGNATLAVLWMLSLFLVAAFTYVLSRADAKPTLGTLATGYATELEAARLNIRVQKRHFQGSLDFKDRRGFIPPDSPSMQYIGSSADVDAAWEVLTEDRYFLLSDDEAKAAYRNENISRYWNNHHGGYVAGLDVLHTLHCLNHIRKTLYPDVYQLDPENAQTHGAHCVDHLRQLAMCNVDLTPIPTQFFEGIGQNYINSSRVHTCRDFWSVREWASERYNGSLAVKPRNRDGSPRAEFFGPWG